jgi:phosphatidylinositol 3-kinase
MSRLKAVRATERLREMLSTNGPCEELTTLRVPLPLNPSLLLEGLVPGECGCFKSAQLPVKLAYRVAGRPIDWNAPAPLAPPHPTPAPHRAASGAHSGGGGGGGGGGSDGGGGGGASGHEAGASALAGSGGAGAGGGAAGPPAAAQAAALPPSCRTALAVSEADPAALRCVMIYKKGDDLRQDQFVLQVGRAGRGRPLEGRTRWKGAPARPPACM